MKQTKASHIRLLTDPYRDTDFYQGTRVTILYKLIKKIKKIDVGHCVRHLVQKRSVVGHLVQMSSKLPLGKISAMHIEFTEANQRNVSELKQSLILVRGRAKKHSSILHFFNCEEQMLLRTDSWEWMKVGGQTLARVATLPTLVLV